jgi:hypothetical protein
MKPINVEHHEHFFIYGEDKEEGPRFDAYVTKDGESGVWSPQTDQCWPADSFAQAKAIAKKMAETHASLTPK